MNKLGTPIGMAIEPGPGSDAEAKELLEQFMGKAKPALDLLMEHLLAAVAAGDFVHMGIWATTLQGLSEDLRGVLARHPVVVVPDASRD